MKKIVDGKEVEVNESELGEMFVWNEEADGGMTMDSLNALADRLISNPYPNEHAARLRDPGMAHVRVRRSSGSGDGMVQGVKVPSSIDIIWYIVKTAAGGEAPVAQALRFPKDKWTEAEAKNWLSKNKIKKVSFEPASEPSTNSLRHLMSALIKKDKLGGRDHFVVPTILITEGVHNNVLYTAEELAKFPQSWNGEPVVIWHPELNGKPVTANSPEIYEKQTVGKLYNCTFSDGKLRGECWIDCEKVKEVSPEVVKMLQEEKPIEVSTGLFVEDEQKEGLWNGEKYLRIAHHFRPDHLALLPGGKGACSWDDGAGMPRLNQQQPETNELSPVEAAALEDHLKANKTGDVSKSGEFVGGFAGCVVHFQGKGLSKESATKLCAYIGRKAGKINQEGEEADMFVMACGDTTKARWEKVTSKRKAKAKKDEPKTNELSHEDVRNELYDLIKPVDPQSPMVGYSCVCAVYDDRFIYRRSVGGEDVTFSQNYTIDANDTVSLDGEPVEVEQVVSYEPIAKPVTNTAGSKGGQEATEHKGGTTMDRTQKVEALIAAGKKPASEKAALIALSDEEFAKVETEAAKVEVKPEAPAANAAPKEPEATKPPVVPEAKAPEANAKPAPETLESVLAGVKSPELKANLEHGVKLVKVVREGLIGEIVANKLNSYTKEQLEAKATSELEMLAKLAGSSKTVTDFSAAAPAKMETNAASGDVPAMPGLFAKKQ